MKEEIKLNNVIIKGDYIKDNNPHIFIANHICIRDGIYIPYAIGEKVVALASSNTVYKKGLKEDFMNKYLYMLPIEIYGDKFYTEALIEKCITLLKKNINILIFPEGVYSTDSNINRAHTSFSRIIFKALDNNIQVHLTPINLKIEGITKDKASIDFSNEKAYVTFLNEINTIPYYNKYKKTTNKNIIFHSLADDAMKIIANYSNKSYNDKYKPYVEKEKLYIIDGTLKDISILKDNNYFNDYKDNLDETVKKILEKK